MAKSAQKDKKERQSLMDKPVGGSKSARFLSAVSKGAKKSVANMSLNFGEMGLTMRI